MVISEDGAEREKRKAAEGECGRDYDKHNSLGMMAGLKFGLWNTIIMDPKPGPTTF